MHHALPTLICSLFALPLAAAQEAKSVRSPNLIVILADDMGWGDAACCGGTRLKTPNIDRMAREGMRFEDAHASAAVCTPTRYSLLTGQYSWRRNVVGLNKGVANGDSPLLIPVAATTLPGILKTAGYRTAAVGKWHLGFGTSKPDYNQDLTPGPLEIGFNEFFGFPATNDRIPTVFVRDHRVVGLDPGDPIRYTYQNPAKGDPGLTKFAAGRNRIGWMSGGKAAFWKDEEIADTFTREAIQFIERSRAKPFFLYFAPHDVHAPTIPGPRFAGVSGLGKRADMLYELDWTVGEVLKTLERLELSKDTLIVFTSDNGAYAVDESGHLPNGPWRGKKSQLWEGGHRVPFIAHWPGHIPPGVSKDLVSLIDLPATAAALVGAKLPPDAAPDSFNLLPTLLGTGSAVHRDHLIVMSGKGDLAIRQGQWKYIPDLATANGWESGTKKNPNAPARPGLFNLSNDPGESTNLHPQHPEISQRLAGLLKSAESTPITRPQ